MPLKYVVIEEPFKQWGLDFIGVINPNSSMIHKFIMNTIDYFKIWLEEISCKNTYQEVVMEMIKRLITQFGIPKTIISDNGSAFIGTNLSKFVSKYGIYWFFSSNYYP